MCSNKQEETELYYAARRTAITYLSKGAFSSGALRKKLEEQAYPPDLIERIIKEMAKEGYTQDRLLATNLLKQRRGSRAESHFALQKRMEQRGISATEISLALATAPSEKLLVQEYLEAKQASLLAEYLEASEAEKQPLRQKLCQRAASRAFPYNLVLQYLAEREKQED